VMKRSQISVSLRARLFMPPDPANPQRQQAPILQAALAVSQAYAKAA